MALEEGAPAEAGHEAEVLALALVGHRQPGVAGELADGVLREPAEREAEPVEQRRVELREHVALVLGGVGGGAHERAVLVARDARVVAGGEPRGAEGVGQLEHRVEAHLAVAAHARVRRAPGGVAVEEAVDHLGAEALAQVEREVRDAHPVGERRARRSRPAGSSSSCRRRWRGRPRARASRQPPRRPRRARAGRPRRCPRRRSWRRACAARSAPAARLRPSRPAPSARCSASAASSAAWRLGGVSPPSASATSSGGDPGRLQERPALHQLDDRAGSGRDARRSPRRRSPPRRSARPRSATAMRTRSPQAAPPAAPVWGSPARAPLPEGASRCSANDRTEGNAIGRTRAAADRLEASHRTVCRWVAPACRCRIR